MSVGEKGRLLSEAEHEELKNEIEAEIAHGDTPPDLLEVYGALLDAIREGSVRILDSDTYAF